MLWLGLVSALLFFPLFLRKGLGRVHMKEQKTEEMRLPNCGMAHRSSVDYIPLIAVTLIQRSTVSHATLCLERQPFGSRGSGIAKG